MKTANTRTYVGSCDIQGGYTVKLCIYTIISTMLVTFFCKLLFCNCIDFSDLLEITST